MPDVPDVPEVPGVSDLTRYLEPVRKAIVVRRTPAEAFEIFTARISSWWPTSSYSIYQAESASCGIEPRVGGDVYEISKGGERCVWGAVLAWEPAVRLVVTWHPGRPADSAQEVEVRFIPTTEGTRVELEHRGWDRFGPHAAEAREGYDGGWVHVFEGSYQEACR